jgi:hypothetical protein
MNAKEAKEAKIISKNLPVENQAWDKSRHYEQAYREKN